MPRPHFVLVHGAYHRAWHLKPLRAKLEEAGYIVSDLDLPSSGQEFPEGGMSTDAAAIKDLLEEVALTSESVILVLHSYAGVPGSEAVAELSDAAKKKIQRIVYLAAVVIGQGASLTPPAGTISSWTRLSLDETCITVPDPVPIFYQDVEPQLAEEASKRLVKMPRSCFTESTKHAGWRDFPRTFVRCEDDQALTKARTELMFTLMSEEDRAGWDFVSMGGGHSPFLARPEETAILLGKIAKNNL